MDLPTCNSLWIGDRLGPLAAACLASFVRRGHRVRLHAYRRLDDLPAGVELVDAASVLPESEIIVHRGTGSPALFANRFRYRLMARGAGIWIDTDLYCVRPIDFEGEAIFGLEQPDTINNAVLKLAADDPVLVRLEALFTERTPIPPWVRLATYRRLHLRLKRVLGLRHDLGRLPWGVAGPKAVTYLLREAGRFDDAHPADVFYPVHWSQTERLRTADGDVDALVTPRTRTIHLWNKLLTERRIAAPEKGSFLDRLLTGRLP